MPTPLSGSPQRLLRGLRHVPTSPARVSTNTSTTSNNTTTTSPLATTGYQTSPLSQVLVAATTVSSTTSVGLTKDTITNRCLFGPPPPTSSTTSSTTHPSSSVAATTTFHQRRFCCSAAATASEEGGGGSSPHRRIRIPLDTRVVDIPQPNSNNITVTTSIIESAIKCERGVKSAWAVCKGVHDAVRGKGIHAPHTTSSSTTAAQKATAASSVSNRPHLDATIDTIVGEDAPSDGLKRTSTTSTDTTTTTPPPPAVKKFAIKSVRLGDDYLPLSTFHPAFHQFEASPHSTVHDPSFWANKKSKTSSKDVATAQSLYEKRARRLLRRRKDKQPLSTAHPVFGAPPQSMPHELFSGPVYISGFFLAVDPNFAYSPRDVMNPNARLTIRDKDGNFSRARYKCHLESDAGFKLEAIVRLQVGWISPHAIFSELPTVIALGKGFDVSIPGLFQFTMVNILDETGCSTGSCLYLSGTPTMGFSLSFTNIVRGRLVLNPTHEIDPSDEKYHFFTSHRIHYRQFGFLLMKMVTWGLCIVLALPMLDVPNHVRCYIKANIPQPYSGYVLWALGQPRKDEEDLCPDAITSGDDDTTTK